MRPETWVAIYAAIIGTSAFFLNLKSWWDSGPKLKLSLIPDGIIIGGGSEMDEKDLIILNVTNRGAAATMITTMVLFEMSTWWQRLRRRPRKSYVIPNPQVKGYPLNVPSDLEPSKRWTGLIRSRPDLKVDPRDGNHYVGIYVSHRDRPYLMRIPKAKDKLPKGTTQLAQ
jgi:hypothetical protein